MVNCDYHEIGDYNNLTPYDSTNCILVLLFFDFLYIIFFHFFSLLFLPLL